MEYLLISYEHNINIHDVTEENAYDDNFKGVEVIKCGMDLEEANQASRLRERNINLYYRIVEEK